MAPDKQEALNSACTYFVGSLGLSTACLDFTHWWHFIIGAVSTALVLNQAVADLPKTYRKVKSWLNK